MGEEVVMAVLLGVLERFCLRAISPGGGTHCSIGAIDLETARHGLGTDQLPIR